jgi:hypothetical protein
LKAPAGRDLAQRRRHHDFAFVIVREDTRAWQNRNDLERLIHSRYDVSAVRSRFIVLVPRADAPANDRRRSVRRRGSAMLGVQSSPQLKSC